MSISGYGDCSYINCKGTSASSFQNSSQQPLWVTTEFHNWYQTFHELPPTCKQLVGEYKDSPGFQVFW